MNGILILYNRAIPELICMDFTKYEAMDIMITWHNEGGELPL